jgi:hypothetical protein
MKFIGYAKSQVMKSNTENEYDKMVISHHESSNKISPGPLYELLKQKFLL